MRWKDIPPFSWFRRKKDEEDKRKKRLLLWLIFPFSLLGLGGITVGALAATTDLFSPRAGATDIATIFDDSNNWKATPTPTGVPAGYQWDTVQNANISAMEVIMCLKNDTSWQSIHSSNVDVINDIDIAIPSSPTDLQWLTITITAKLKSRLYTGTFNFYVYIQNSEHGNLNNDFNVRAIDLSSTTGVYSVNDVSLFNAIQNTTSGANNNNNLDTNAILLKYNPTGAGGSFVNWNWGSGNFGIGTTGVNQTESLKCWVIDNDQYENIQIAPDPTNPYYAGQTPINFTLKLYRSPLKDATGYSTDKSNWTGIFYATPTENNYFTAFDTLFDTKTWYANKLDGVYQGTWGFKVGTTTQGGIFKIKGNPFYSSYINEDFATAESVYKYAWSVVAPVNVKTVIINSSSAPITDLDGVFYKHPNETDVIARLKERIKSDIVDAISWNQISINITKTNTTQGYIELKGVDGSLLYTSNVDQIDYTLKS